MGTLVAKAYPTQLFANLADHTYVECLGGGKGWSCWGGKSGGRVIASGPASTKRADCIAQPNERAGIDCYLVNGVCHQAANRILIQARVTVRSARGYSISSALFGTYGRTLSWPCTGTFQRCPNVSGDLPACQDSSAPERGEGPLHRGVLRSREPRKSSREAQYLEEVLELYAQPEDEVQVRGQRSVRGRSSLPLQVELFRHFAEYQMGKEYKAVEGGLVEVREETETAIQQLQRAFAEEEIPPHEYVYRFDQLTLQFQDMMADALSASEYRALFALQPEERVSLVDPRIVQEVYGV